MLFLIFFFSFISQLPNEEQVKILMALCDHAKDDKIQVQCIGTLGCLAQCQNPSAIDANLVRLSHAAFFSFCLFFSFRSLVLILFCGPLFYETGDFEVPSGDPHLF